MSLTTVSSTTDEVVAEALRAFATDLDYATGLVSLYVNSTPPPHRPRVSWGSPPRVLRPHEAPPVEDLAG